MATKKDLIELVECRKTELLREIEKPSLKGKGITLSNDVLSNIIEKAVKDYLGGDIIVETPSYITNYVYINESSGLTKEEYDEIVAKNVDIENYIVDEWKRLVTLIKLSDKGTDAVEEVRKFLECEL